MTIHGGSVTYNTRHIQGDRSPINWNQWIDFGGRISLYYFDMSVWDADVGSDDLMLTTQSMTLGQDSQFRCLMKMLEVMMHSLAQQPTTLTTLHLVVV